MKILYINDQTKWVFIRYILFYFCGKGGGKAIVSIAAQNETTKQDSFVCTIGGTSLPLVVFLGNDQVQKPET